MGLPRNFRCARSCGRALALLFALALLPCVGRGQSADDGFDPNPDHAIRALAVQGDGRILVGGDFSLIGGENHSGLARLNADGSADTAFVANVDDTVQAIAVQADGRIVIGGYFTHAGGYARNHLARLNADGSVDTTFDPDANGVVFAVAAQSDGKLVVGGGFTALAPNGGASVTRNRIARLNADGTLDSGFDPNASDGVTALAVQPGGKLLVAGFFGELAPNGGSGVTRIHLARLYANGTVDNTFDPASSNGYVFWTFAAQPDGKVVVGGDFNVIGAYSRNRIARLNVDGSVDATFDPNANATVNVLAVQADGKVLVAGDFTTLAPNGAAAVARNHIARLNADGTLDTSFNPDANAGVYALALQVDGKALVAGDFTTLGTQSRNHFGRLDTDGSVDGTADPAAQPLSVFALGVQPDGKVLVGGEFTSMSGQTRNHIARLNVDGTLDTAFNPNVDGIVYALAVQPDGKLVLAGFFTTAAPNGGAAVARNHIARFNADGSLDATFNPNANDYVDAVVVQPDGKLLIGGGFTALAPNGGASIARSRVARLNADGSVDAAFNPDVNGDVYALAVQADGKLVIGGDFTEVGGQTRNHIARLNGDGSVDLTFDPNADSWVGELAFQPDGKLVVGGAFTNLSANGGAAVMRNRIARLNADGTPDAAFDPNASDDVWTLALQADGKLIVGGYFSVIGGQARNAIARLNANGSVDTAFDANADGAVYALALQPDAKLVAGGGFTMIGGQSRSKIARLSTPDAAPQSLDLGADGTSVIWKRAGAGPELASSPRLLYSSNGSSYAPLGTMQRVSGGWRYTGFIAPIGQTFYLRTQAQVSFGAGACQGASGLIESTRQFYRSDAIFADRFE